MPIDLTMRRAGDVTVMTCAGRLVEGMEVATLDRAVDDVLPFTRYVVVCCEGVEFVDSSGLGLLVRLLHRTRRAGGNLTLCAASPRLTEALHATRLLSVFSISDDETEAIAACYQRPIEAGTAFGAPDVLCVHPSPDVLAYLRELLDHSGYVLISATNLSDALTLLRATAPKSVVIAHELRAGDTPAARTFNALAEGLGVLELPDGFARQEAGEAGGALLSQIAAMVSPSGPGAASL